MTFSGQAAEVKQHQFLYILWFSNKPQGYPEFKGEEIHFLLLVGEWHGYYILKKHLEYKMLLQSSLQKYSLL